MILRDKDIKESAHEIVDDYILQWKRKYKNLNGLLDCLSENLQIDSYDEREDNSDE